LGTKAFAWLVATLVGFGVCGVVLLDTVAASRTAWTFGGVTLATPPQYALSGLLAAGLLILFAVLKYGAFVSRHRFAIMVGVIMLSSHLMAIGRGPLTPLAFAILVLLALWVLEHLTNPDATWIPSGFVMLVFLFFLTIIASMLGGRPFSVFADVLATSLKLLLAVMLVDILRTRDMVRRGVWMMLVAAAVGALAGVLQSILFYGFGIELSLAEHDYRYAHAPFGTVLRATGFSRFANQFAPPLVIAALVSAALCLSGGMRKWRWGLGVVALLCTLAVVASMARGAWLALLIGLVLLPLVARPHRATLWLGVGIPVLLAAWLAGPIPWALKKLHGLSESGLIERGMLLSAGLKTMAAHPLNGVGVGNFGPYSPTLERHPVHNAMLQVGSELGVFGLLIYITIFVWVGAQLVIALRAADDPLRKAELRALLSGLLGLLIVIQAEPMGYSQFVWIYLALAESMARVGKIETPDKRGIRAT
jgi:O-antigen ligase